MNLNRYKPKAGYNNYSVTLTSLAKENRNNPTRAEEKLWYEILRSKKTGFKFSRQKPIHNFILDFYCSKLLLAIEVDGESHGEQEEYDQRRTEILNARDIKVIRYTNDDVLECLDGVWEDLMEKVEERKRELNI